MLVSHQCESGSTPDLCSFLINPFIHDIFILLFFVFFCFLLCSFISSIVVICCCTTAVCMKGLKSSWSHVRRVMSSLTQPNIDGFLLVLRFAHVVALDP